jgi:hypothetical protein
MYIIPEQIFCVNIFCRKNRKKKRITALNEKYKMPFDKTMVDIIVNAELPEIREIGAKNWRYECVRRPAWLYKWIQGRCGVLL